MQSRERLRLEWQQRLDEVFVNGAICEITTDLLPEPYIIQCPRLMVQDVLPVDSSVVNGTVLDGVPTILVWAADGQTSTTVELRMWSETVVASTGARIWHTRGANLSNYVIPDVAAQLRKHRTQVSLEQFRIVDEGSPSL